MKSISLFLGALLLLMGSPASGQERSLEAQKKATEAQIKEWIVDLGSSNFDEREIAITNLLELGPRAISHLEKAIKESESREIRWNAKRVLREVRDQEKRQQAVPRGMGKPPSGSLRERQLEDLQRQIDERIRRMEERFRDLHDMFPRRMEPFDDLDKQFFQRSLKFPDLQGSRYSVSIKEGPDGVRVEKVETRDGKEFKEVFEADSVEAFREKYPEVAREHGIGGSKGNFFHFTWKSDPTRTDRDSSFRWRFRGPQQDLDPRDSFRLFLAPEQMQGPRLGVHVDEVDSSLASFLGLEPGVGLLVNRVVEKSLAQSLGIQVGDVLVKINDKPIRGVATIHRALQEQDLGQETSVEVERRGKGRLILKGQQEEQPEKPLKREAKDD